MVLPLLLEIPSRLSIRLMDAMNDYGLYLSSWTLSGSVNLIPSGAFTRDLRLDVCPGTAPDWHG